MRLQRVVGIVVLAALLGACSGMSWNPLRWFDRAPPLAPPPVEVLTIEPASENGDGDRFVQSWDGARLIVDIHSARGIGRATLRPAGGAWPLKLAFRLHVSALEGFEVRGAQNLRISLGPEPLTDPALIDVPYGTYTKETAQLEIQWVDHYR